MTAGEQFAFFTLSLRLPPLYVLDDMTMAEADVLLTHSYLATRDDWERTRLQMWATVQPHSKKSLKADDMLHFPWDNSKKVTTISNEDVARLKERAKKIEQQWQK